MATILSDMNMERTKIAERKIIERGCCFLKSKKILYTKFETVKKIRMENNTKKILSKWCAGYDLSANSVYKKSDNTNAVIKKSVEIIFCFIINLS